jgi:hypothetical protein
MFYLSTYGFLCIHLFSFVNCVHLFVRFLWTVPRDRSLHQLGKVFETSIQKQCEKRADTSRGNIDTNRNLLVDKLCT